MRTPFDPAMRVQQRTLDAIRIQLAAETACEQALAEASSALADDLAREAAIAATDWQIGAHPYGMRVRARRATIEQDRVAADCRLQHLRGVAMEACGQMQAITEAAASYAAERQRSEAAADQTQADDLTGSRNSRRPPAGHGLLAVLATASL